MLFIKKKLANKFRDTVIRKKLIRIGLTMGIIGAIGYIFAGVFNLDRPGPNGIYHGVSAVVTFGGLIISISIFCFYILVYKVNICKAFAIYGLIIPLLSALMWYITGILLFEWIAFLSILGFLMPFQSKRIILKLSVSTNLR